MMTNKTDVEQRIVDRLTPTLDALALTFCHEPPERVDAALAAIRLDIARDLGEVTADIWVEIVKARIADVSAVRPGAA
jgi:hypothetical protein